MLIGCLASHKLVSEIAVAGCETLGGTCVGQGKVGPACDSAKWERRYVGAGLSGRWLSGTAAKWEWGWRESQVGER